MRAKCLHCDRHMSIKSRGLCSTCYKANRSLYPIIRPLFGDDDWGVPLVCVCLIAQPDRLGECQHCHRPVVSLWGPDRYKAALDVYPELAGQTIDWTHRTAKAVS